MFMLFASLALADSGTLLTAAPDESAPETPDAEAPAFRVEADFTSDRVAYQLLQGQEEVGWGFTAVGADGFVLVRPTMALSGELELLLTPVDEEDFAVGPTVVHEIQAAFGRGTRATVSQAGGKTELL